MIWACTCKLKTESIVFRGWYMESKDPQCLSLRVTQSTYFTLTLSEQGTGKAPWVTIGHSGLAKHIHLHEHLPVPSLWSLYYDKITSQKPCIFKASMQRLVGKMKSRGTGFPSSANCFLPWFCSKDNWICWGKECAVVCLFSMSLMRKMLVVVQKR
jgi:hypothetical protein